MPAAYYMNILIDFWHASSRPGRCLAWLARRQRAELEVPLSYSEPIRADRRFRSAEAGEGFLRVLLPVFEGTLMGAGRAHQRCRMQQTAGGCCSAGRGFCLPVQAAARCLSTTVTSASLGDCNM